MYKSSDYDVGSVRHGVELMHAVNQSSSFEEVMQHVHQIAVAVGATSVGYSFLDVDKPIRWSSAPKAWQSAYQEENLVAFDPGYKRGTRPKAPAFCRFVDGYPGFSREHRSYRIFSRMRDFNLRGAFLIPDKCLLNQNEMAALNVITSVDETHLNDWHESNRSTLELLGGVVHKRLRALHRPNVAQQNPLTDREMDVVGQLLGGHRTARIAYNLDISEKTVEFHVANIKQKIGARTRDQILALVIENNWLDL